MPGLSPKTCLQWLSLVGIIWLQAINGTNTNFPAYSSQLKTAMSMSQLQLNNLAFASDAGKLFGWLSGLAALRFPLWLVLAAGSALGLAGYGLQCLSLAGHVSLAYWQVFALTVLAGNSICWINTVSFLVTIRNFPPRYRQVAVGLATSYQGLSAKIYTDVVDASSVAAANRAEAYLLLNSLLPLVVCVVAMPFVRGVEVGESNNARSMEVGFVMMFVITVATGIYSVMSSLGLFASANSGLKSVVGTAVFLLLPLAIPVAEKARKVLERWALSRGKRVYSFTSEENNNNNNNNDHGNVVGEKLDEGHGDGDDFGVVREEIGVRKMAKRVDFWLYFFVYFASATLGLVFLNNLGQIAESRGYSNTSSLVSLSSSFGFFGRLVPSLLDYHFSRSKYMVSRPGLIAILVAPIAGSFFLLLNPTSLSLYVATAVIGVCTGAITSISVLTTSELFGTENFSVNHNVLVANIPIGSFLFGYWAAILYRREGTRAGLDGKCMGMKCYRDTFLLWGLIASLGTVWALILYVRTKKFYSQR